MPLDLPTILIGFGFIAYVVGFWMVVGLFLETPRCPVCWRPASGRDHSACKESTDEWSR